ncbi:BrnT family toxin [Longimicrobium sp.]|uniref:BrnT family toxin n=1 Tax=Longimicrobium sp. TaxID=2029185 RepID=UPI002CE45F5D|nr:BrnT family toxin [Longimicrobium sp.]HSU17533.1 BrnT family toxin [Longimicrobium sp.]
MLSYEWDPNKAESNHAKHGVRFSAATAVFADDGAITIADDDPREERHMIIGHDGAGRLLVVVFTWRGDELVRLISARKATRTEAQFYYLSGP